MYIWLDCMDVYLLWENKLIFFSLLELIKSIFFIGLLPKYCIKGNVNVCLIFPNLPNGFETGTIKTLSLITFVGMLG